MSFQTVVLAGGLATRMLPATQDVPKALLPVAGRPFAEWQLELLARQGVDRVVYCVGHLGEQIETAVGNGSRFGLSITYSDERGQLMGTGGAIRLAYDRSLLDREVFVLYGDSYLPVSFEHVADAYRDSLKPALMTVVLNEGDLGLSNARYDSGLVTAYDKAAAPDSTLNFVDFGLSVIQTELVDKYLEPGVVHDLGYLFSALSRERLLAGHEMTTRYYEVGSPNGLEELEDFLLRSHLSPQ